MRLAGAFQESPQFLNISLRLVKLCVVLDHSLTSTTDWVRPSRSREKTSSRSSILCHSSLSFTYNRYENGHQLVRLVCQRLQLISPAKSCSFQQLQPIRCLLKFLHATFYVDRRTTVFVTLAGKTCPSSLLGGTSTCTK